MEERKQAFITSVKQTEAQSWNIYDFIFPAGKLSKLCKISDVNAKDINLTEILTKFKLNEGKIKGFPVCILAGAKENLTRGKFLAGIARVAYRLDAVVIDSGFKVGIESFAIRRNVKLIGVAPENCITFPRINPTSVDPNELTNGHSHLFLLKMKQGEMKWGDEAQFKFNLANKIANNKKARYKCKIAVVLLADSGECMEEIKLAVENEFPIIVVKGSEICDEIISSFTVQNYQLKRDYLKPYLEQGHFYILDNNSSEDIAAYLHFFLTVTPYDAKKKQEVDSNNNGLQEF